MPAQKFRICIGPQTFDHNTVDLFTCLQNRRPLGKSLNVLYALNRPQSSGVHIGPGHPIRPLGTSLVGRDDPQVCTEAHHELTHIALKPLNDGQ